MIESNRIYIRTNEDLMLKGKGGYTTGDQFNRASRDAENYLLEFLVQKERETRRNMDALAPFVAETHQTITLGYAALPDDYVHKRDWYLRVQDTNCVGNNLVYNNYELRELKSGEYSNLINSPIRRPTITKPRAELIGSSIKVYPSTTTGDIYLKYIRTPVYAEWAYELDEENDQENYDVYNSVDYEWMESEANALIDILLFLKGVQIRDSEIVQWLAAKKQIIENV